MNLYAVASADTTCAELAGGYEEIRDRGTCLAAAKEDGYTANVAISPFETLTAIGVPDAEIYGCMLHNSEALFADIDPTVPIAARTHDAVQAICVRTQMA